MPNRIDLLNAALSNRYSIEREIGVGGMATVYLAKDLRHRRPIAIKVMNPEIARGGGTERFLREIEVTGNLQHPNILTLVDSGDIGGTPYFVMPYVEGQSLRDRLTEEHRMGLAEAVRITGEIADALEYAHRTGIVHRDIKPGNVLLSEGHAMVADFGVTAALSESVDSRLTETGSSVGSPVYMSPEQASGEGAVDGRSDQYSLACLLYELISGDPPFKGSLVSLMAQKAAGNITPLDQAVPGVPNGVTTAVNRALNPDPEDRFATAGEFRDALRAGLAKEVSPGLGRRRMMGVVVALVLVSVLAVVAVQRAMVRNTYKVQRLAGIEAMALAGDYPGAFALADTLETEFPGDASWSELWPRFSYSVPIHSDPPGAEVYVQRYDEVGESWEFLGNTPLEDVRFAGRLESNDPELHYYRQSEHYRLRLELNGYRPVELTQSLILGNEVRGVPPVNPVRLMRMDLLPEDMIRVPAFRVRDIEFDEYFIDRYEVSNRQFSAFVEAGGYRNPEFWIHPFIVGNEEITFEEATASFEDQTGQPGPATWRLGTYPDGHGELPVGGVSWYEAAAFARFSEKELPTVTHWEMANPHYWANAGVVIPRANLESEAPWAVGESAAMSSLGVFDLAGNVREWCFNAVGAGERATRGGAWTDPGFIVAWIVPKSPWDRDETNGFRTVQTFDPPEVLEASRGPLPPVYPPLDYMEEDPASEAEFEVFRGMYAYDGYDLDARIEETDTADYWIRQTVSFLEPYGERGGAYIYLPRDAAPPLQTIVYWGGSEVLSFRSIDEQNTLYFDFLLRHGRAVAVPMFKGGYTRDPGNDIHHQTLLAELSGTVYRDYTIQWVKDLSATLDYLEDRDDMDMERVGYLGFSFGGLTAPIVLAVEPRFKAAVLNVGGLLNTNAIPGVDPGDPDSRFRPEIDPFNFLPRVRKPFLMIGGENDIVFPIETSQRPMFELLGTDTEHKDHFISPSSHIVPLDDVIRGALDWFEVYLGAPGAGGQVP